MSHEKRHSRWNYFMFFILMIRGVFLLLFKDVEIPPLWNALSCTTLAPFYFSVACTFSVDFGKVWSFFPSKRLYRSQLQGICVQCTNCTQSLVDALTRNYIFNVSTSMFGVRLTYLLDMWIEDLYWNRHSNAKIRIHIRKAKPHDKDNLLFCYFEWEILFCSVLL